MIAIVPVVAAASKPVHRCSLIYSDSRCGRAGTAFVGEQNRGRAKPQTNRASNEVRRSHLDAAALLPCCPAALLPCCPAALPPDSPADLLLCCPADIQP